MQQLQVKRAAVLGAGVMGAQIAAHLVNAGIETLLYDLPATDGPANGHVDKSISQLTKLKPTPLATQQTASLLHAKNYQDNLAELKECDLIIEAIAERIDWKEALYQQVAPTIAENALFVTNTSGLSVERLSEALPEALRPRFCGVHFFNPPRYMHLCEIIATPQSTPAMLASLEAFLVTTLGKGVVRAKDTPNFIANRIGVFSMLATIYHTKRFEMRFDEVDLLTGLLLGRPKSATFRTMDVVGLDTMAHVVATMQTQLTDDPWHRYYTLPDWFNGLIEKGAIGQKSGGGIYKKVGRDILVFDSVSKDYVPASASVDDEVHAIFKLDSMSARFTALKKSNNKQAQFIYACYQDLFHYCAVHLASIADTVRDVDLAVRFGFGWQQGPFETWQAAGFTAQCDALSQSIDKNQLMSDAPLPKWLTKIENFYQTQGAFSASQGDFIPRSSLPVYQRQLTFEMVPGERGEQGTTTYEDEAVRLWSHGDGIGILSFKSKLNAVGEDVLDGILSALEIAEKTFSSLVIWQQDAQNFSVGANLKQFVHLFNADKATRLHEVVYKFQQTALRLKYATIPVVAAVRGRALGGGCELLMQCAKVVASFESYIGLVEIGVGLLPAGGGCKEFAMRAVEQAAGGDTFCFIEKAFKQLSMAQVSHSAVDAKGLGFMRESDVVVMNSHEVLYVAKVQAKAMADSGYLPPMKHLTLALGRESLARLKMIVVNMREGGFISEHDAIIAEKIAYVLCGGDVDEGTMVDEAWYLRLEIEAFVQLAQTEKTRARVEALLATGRPLRN